MTHDQIDEMPAGPELDALACAAVGWKRTEYRNPFLDKVVIDVRPVSTDIATAMEALETAGVHYDLSRRELKSCKIWLSPSKQSEATGEELTLAIARALAKMGAA